MLCGEIHFVAVGALWRIEAGLGTFVRLTAHDAEARCGRLGILHSLTSPACHYSWRRHPKCMRICWTIVSCSKGHVEIFAAVVYTVYI